MRDTEPTYHARSLQPRRDAPRRFAVRTGVRAGLPNRKPPPPPPPPTHPNPGG